jgi:membrane protease YdiL (CAAX protease family)
MTTIQSIQYAPEKTFFFNKKNHLSYSKIGKICLTAIVCYIAARILFSENLPIKYHGIRAARRNLTDRLSFDLLYTFFPTSNFLSNVLVGVLGAVARIALTKLAFATATFALGFFGFTIIPAIITSITTAAVIKSSFLIPIAEEILIRGFLLAGEMKIFSENKAIFENAKIFSILHLTNVFNCICAFGAGILYGRMRVITGNLWASTIAHSLYNLNILFDFI